ncbi:MAG: Chitinase [Proteobacteria bacterium]|nr:Chitinase [Pseudomonadota bacterium]
MAGSKYLAPASIPLTVTAADSDGTIAKVEYYQGATLVSTSTTASYSATWANAPAGTYSLTAKATDNAGGVTTCAAVTITVKTLVTQIYCLQGDRQGTPRIVTKQYHSPEKQNVIEATNNASPASVRQRTEACAWMAIIDLPAIRRLKACPTASGEIAGD